MASTKGAIIHPCPPATPQSAESAAVHWRIPHLLLLGAEGGKIKGIAMGPHQIKAQWRRWAIKAPLLCLSPLHDVYLSLCRARRASNGLLSRPLSLTAVLRFESAMIYRAARPSGDSGASERAGWLHHAIVNGYSTDTHMWVLDDENGKRALLESGLSSFHFCPKSDVTALLCRVAYCAILPVNVTQAL